MWWTFKSFNTTIAPFLARELDTSLRMVMALEKNVLRRVIVNHESWKEFRHRKLLLLHPRVSNFYAVGDTVFILVMSIDRTDKLIFLLHQH